MKGKKKIVSQSIWNPKPSKLFTYKVPSKSRIKKISKKNLTWPQAKIKYPKMNPFRDTDRDGVPNFLDCRPFNKKKDGIVSSIKSVVTKVNAPVTKAVTTTATVETAPITTTAKKADIAADKAVGGALPGGITKVVPIPISSSMKKPIVSNISKPLTKDLPGAGSSAERAAEQKRLIQEAIARNTEPVQEAIPIKYTSSKGAILPISTPSKGAILPREIPKSKIQPILKPIISVGTKVGTSISKLPSIIQTKITPKNEPLSAYAGIPYSSGKTMAVEKGTGRIAREYGLNTQNADLEDHYFIEVNGRWKDMGIYNPTLRENIPQ